MWNPCLLHRLSSNWESLLPALLFLTCIERITKSYRVRLSECSWFHTFSIFFLHPLSTNLCYFSSALLWKCSSWSSDSYMLFFNSIHNLKMSLDDLKITNLFTYLSCRKPSEVLRCSYVNGEICNIACNAGNGLISISSPSIALGLCFTKSLCVIPTSCSGFEQ